MGYTDYLPYLLSDHVPIYFDYTDNNGYVCRVLFANTGSLLAQRGVLDNSKAFGNITLEELQQWSKKLVDPVLKGMVDLIKHKENERTLRWAKTWQTQDKKFIEGE